MSVVTRAAWGPSEGDKNGSNPEQEWSGERAAGARKSYLLSR
jgi:hypothetical protein